MSIKPFPYPAAFYLVAHLGNSAYHAPELWLKLGGALFSALALLPLGFLARKLSPERHVDLAASLVYLLTPALTRSLLLLELSALLGHLMDLVFIAYLARISLELVPARRVVAAGALIATSLTVSPCATTFWISFTFKKSSTGWEPCSQWPPG